LDARKQKSGSVRFLRRNRAPPNCRKEAKVFGGGNGLKKGELRGQSKATTPPTKRQYGSDLEKKKVEIAGRGVGGEV